MLKPHADDFLSPLSDGQLQKLVCGLAHKVFVGDFPVGGCANPFSSYTSSALGHSGTRLEVIRLVADAHVVRRSGALVARGSYASASSKFSEYLAES